MTDQDKAQLTPSEQHLAEELTRIANRQMQVVDRLDKIQERLAEGVVTADDLKMRVERIEGIQKQPTELMQRILMPLMIVNLLAHHWQYRPYARRSYRTRQSHVSALNKGVLL